MVGGCGDGSGGDGGTRAGPEPGQSDPRSLVMFIHIIMLPLSVNGNSTNVGWYN